MDRYIFRMPRITFEWPDGHFRTDCAQIADLFTRSPESFIPSMRNRISGQARCALTELLAEADHRTSAPRSFDRVVDGIRIRVEHLKIRL